MKLKKTMSLVLSLVLLVSVMVACSPSTTTPTEAAATTAPPAVAPTEAAAATPTEAPAEVSTGPKKIFAVLKALGNQYWSIMQAGIEKSGKDNGAEITITGIPDEASIEQQIALLQNAVSAQADAILIAPADSKALVQEIETAAGSGIPIILVDTMAETDNYSAALLTDNIAAGRKAAEELLRLLKEKGTPEDKVGTVAIQIGSSGSQTIVKRMEGFNEYWAANAPENWKLLSDEIKVNDGDISKAVGFGQDFLTGHKDLIAVFAPNNGSTVGFVTAITEAKRTDVTMVGFDFSPEMEAMIRDTGYTVSTMLQRQYFMGYDGVKLALDIINGTQPAQKDIDTGVMVVNFKNVDDPEVIAAAKP